MFGQGTLEGDLLTRLEGVNVLCKVASRVLLDQEVHAAEHRNVVISLNLLDLGHIDLSRSMRLLSLLAWHGNWGIWPDCRLSLVVETLALNDGLHKQGRGDC